MAGWMPVSTELMDVVSDLRGNTGGIFVDRSGDRSSRGGRKIGPALADERMAGWHLTAEERPEWLACFSERYLSFRAA